MTSANAYDDAVAPLAGPAPAANDKYDAAVQGLADDRDSRVRANVFGSSGVNPEQAVRARKIAERTGAAPDAVLRNLPTAERSVAVEDVVAHTADAPVLRDSYAEPYFAQIAGKESGILAKIEKGVRSYMDPQGERSKGLKGGKVVLTPSQFSDRVHQVKEGNPALDWATATRLASQGVAFDNSPGGISESQRPVTNAVNLLTGVGVRLYEGLRQFGSNVQLIDANLHGKDRTEQTRRELIQSENRTFLRAAQPDGYAANQLYQGFVGAAAQLPGIIATGPAGSVAPLLTAFFASSGASGYSDVKLRGGSNSEAALNGLIQGGLEAGTELLPLSFAVKNFERLGVGKVFAEFTGKELLSEMLNTVASKAADTAIANPNKSWADYRAELPQALMDTTLQVLGTAGTLGVISKGMSVVGAHAVRREQDIQQANERAAMLGELFNVAAGANVKKLDAATFGDFVQKVAESTGSDLAQVHVDAAILADTLKQSGVDMDTFAQMSPDAAKELTEALQSGGSVAIPIGDLVGKMGDTGLEQALLPHLRATEDGLSLEEAKVEQATAQEFLEQESSRVMKQAADFHATEQSAEAVRSNIFGQLQATGRFSADVNKAYSTLVGSFYTVLGNNLGVTPEQAYAQFPLRVQGVGQQTTEDLKQTDIGAELNDKINSNFDAAVQEYSALPDSEGGRVINTDIARELSQAYQADRTRSAEVHEPASAFAKRLYAAKLSQPTPAGLQPTVLFTGGGTGAGKSTGLKMLGAAANAEMIFDTNMNNFSSSVAKIEQALDAGRKVHIMYVYRDPVEALAMGTLPRAMRMGRTVPVESHAETHVGARTTAEKLMEKYAGDERVEFTVVDNSKGRGKAEITSLDKIPQVVESGLKEKLHETVKTEYTAGRISEAVARGTSGQNLIAQGAVASSSASVPGQSEQADNLEPAALSDFTQDALPGLLGKTDWAILTAADPGATKQSDEANAAAMAALRQDLDDIGVTYTEAVGKYGDVQPSFIITGIPERVAQALGNKYGQESILTRKGLIYQDGSITPATGIDVFNEAPEDFYTEVPDTGAFFSVQLDFDTRIEPDVAYNQSVSTRVPWAKPRGKNAPVMENPLSERLQVGLEAFRDVPDALDNAMALIVTYPNYRPGWRLRTTESKTERFINEVVGNLLWLHDQIPAEIRERSKLWYDGANSIANDFVERYGVSLAQASAVLAVNSPQTEWFTNVSRAERILDIWHNQQDFRWSPEMEDTAVRILGKDQYADDLAEIRGKTLGELSGNSVQQAMWLRVFDESHNDRAHRIVTPEGTFGDWVVNSDGVTKTKTAWASFGHIAKSIEILQDGSVPNISLRLGNEHKVRSFYNNIFSPTDPVGDVTIDTHAVAAGLLRPLAGSNIEVVHNLGGGVSNALKGLSGTYGIYVEAYRRAAQQRGILPREMQSITWEAVRGLYTDTFKSSAAAAEVEQAWVDFRAGRLTEAEVRARVLELSGGINEPNWWKSDSRPPTETWSSSYGGELSAVRVPGGSAVADTGGSGDGSGERGGAGQSVVDDTATQVEQRRMRQAVDLAVLQAKPSKSDNLAQTAAGEKPGQIALTGVHFSTKPGLNRVDGRFYGTGLKGAEKERIRNGTDSRLAARTYFYVDEGKGVRPEAGVGGNAHEAQLSNLYDINADPLKLIVGGNTNATESNILDAGFDGYYVRDAFNQQGAAVVIGPASYSIPVAPIANPTTKAPPLPPAAPAVYKRGLMSSELNKINIDAIKVVAPSARISAGNFQVLQSEAQAAAAVAAMQGINLPVEYAQGEGTRGTFSPKNLTITLLENADLTTFLHETGHFMLEAMASVTNRVDAPAGMREDMTTLLKWFGVKDMQTWMSLSTDGKRSYHEKFAESFEQYLFEGKAPSVELQGVFRRFRSWMQNVYRSLADFMRSHNTQLSDEVRQVFDRMLATDEAITQAEDAAGMFTDPDATAMAMEKLTARSLRDLKWTINARAKAIKKLQHQAAQLRTAVKAEVQAEVDDMPVFRARDALAALKTDAEHGIDTLPQEEAIAAANGYTGVDHMLHDVLRAGGKAATVEAMVDNRMLERYGDLIDQRAIEKAANEEVHNEARARSLATELAAQTAALNAREDTGKTNAAGSRMTVNVLMKAAKHFASNIIGRTTVRELPGRSRQHLAAERRAGKAWQKATAAGATQDAIRAKKDQVLNNAAAREAMLASEEVAKTIDYFKKFDKDTVRAKLPQEYLDQIDRLLEAIDLRKSTTNREIDRRQSLREWVESQHQLGIDPVLPDYLLDGMRQTSYKELTVDEVRGLKDTIKNIEHLGRLKGKLLKARDQREFDAIVDELAASIREHGGKELPVQLEPDGKVKQFFKGAWADHRKLNSLIHQMDGGKDNGPFYRALVRSMNDSGTQESVMLEQATMALADIFKPVEALPGGLAGGEVFIPEINNTLTRSGRLSIALNWGNTQNRQRVTGGDGWTTMQVEAILRTLSRTELDFVNKVWEHIDSYWPAIKEKQLRVSGVVEDKVEAEPFEVTIDTPNGQQTVQMRGGYYPIKYDSDRSIRAEKNEAAEKAMDILRGAFMRPTTRRGHLKARVDEVNGRPLRKDLSALTQHISQAVHDLSWHEWFIDANRLMNDSRIQSAIRDHYGPQTARAMRDAINAIAVGDAVHQGQIDQLLLRMRSAVTRSIMGFSLTTALLQPFGLTQSMARIGVVPVLKGAARWAGDAMHMENTVGWINEKSDFMRLRNKTFNRELREINQRLHGKSTFARIADASLFMAMQKMQMVADVPTWVGMYEKALAGGVDEGAAIALADEAVLASQGGGTIKDLSAVQRDMPFMTQFYSYFNTTMQLVAEKTALTDFKNPRAVAGWLGDMVLLTVIPSILPAMITFLLKGGGGDDDPEKWAKRMLDWYASYMFGMFVGLRELPTLWSPFSYAGPPAAKLINDGRRLVQQAEQGEIDDQAVLAVIGFMGTALGLPTSQLIRSYKGWQAWDEGKAPPTAMLFGPPPKD